MHSHYGSHIIPYYFGKFHQISGMGSISHLPHLFTSTLKFTFDYISSWPPMIVGLSMFRIIFLPLHHLKKNFKSFLKNYLWWPSTSLIFYFVFNHVCLPFRPQDGSRAGTDTRINKPFIHNSYFLIKNLNICIVLCQHNETIILNRQ